MKTNFFEGCSWFKFNNLELALGMALKFYSSVTKLKAKKFRELIPTVAEVRWEKLVWGSFFGPIPILNRIKLPTFFLYQSHISS